MQGERAAKAGSLGCRSVRYRRETCRVRGREQQRQGLAVAEGLDIEEKRAEKERAAKAGSRGCRSVRCRRETCTVRERESSKGRLAWLQKR